MAHAAIRGERGGEATTVDPAIDERIAAELALARQLGGTKREVHAPHIGAYRLSRWLATGDTSCVFLARRSGAADVEPEVAVKALLAEHEREHARHFTERACAFSLLRHPSLVQVFHAAQGEGPPHMVMEYWPGSSLREILRHRGSVSVDFAVSVIATCAEALHSARSQLSHDGYRYLGIAPSKVMVNASGAVKLLPLAHTGVCTTDAGRAEAAYLSPEHARGDAFDARSEVFSLGVMLYELVLGVHPFFNPSCEPASRSLRDRILYSIIDSPAKRIPGLDGELTAVMMTALSRDPESRFRDCDELHRALCAIAARFNAARAPAPAAKRRPTHIWIARRGGGHEANATAQPAERQQVEPRAPSSPPSTPPRTRKLGSTLLLSLAALVITLAIALVTFALSNAALADQRLPSRPSGGISGTD